MAQRIQPGQLLPGIPSASWNEFVDTTKKVAQLPGPHQQLSGTIGASSLRLPVSNETAANITADFPVLAIDGPVFNTTDRPGVVYEGVKFKGKTPDVTTKISDIVIVQGPIPDGRFRSAVLRGPTWCEIDVTDVAHTHAQPKPGDNTKLASGTSGIKIEWKEAGTGTKKAVIILGGTTSDESSSLPPLRRFELTADKLAASATATVRWLDDAGNLLAPDVTIHDPMFRFSGRAAGYVAGVQGMRGVALLRTDLALVEPDRWEIVNMDGFAHWVIVTYAGSPDNEWQLTSFGGDEWGFKRPVADNAALTITDPLGLFDTPVDGQVAYCELINPDTSPPTYAIRNRRVRIVTGQTTAAVQPTASTFQIDTLTEVSGDLPTSPLTVNQHFPVGYVDNQRVLAIEWAPDQWINTPGDHTRRVRGTVVESSVGIGTATFTLQNLVGIYGPKPATSTITVHNVFQLGYVAGLNAEAQWNEELSRWENTARPLGIGCHLQIDSSNGSIYIDPSTLAGTGLTVEGIGCQKLATSGSVLIGEGYCIEKEVVGGGSPDVIHHDAITANAGVQAVGVADAFQFWFHEYAAAARTDAKWKTVTGYDDLVDQMWWHRSGAFTFQTTDNYAATGKKQLLLNDNGQWKWIELNGTLEIDGDGKLGVKIDQAGGLVAGAGGIGIGGGFVCDSLSGLSAGSAVAVIGIDALGNCVQHAVGDC